MSLPFRDRHDAGRQLAARLVAYANRPDVIVLGLPRGGIPVAAEVAEALGVPLDAFLVRKLGVPGHEELAMGAIASGGLRVLNDDVVEPLAIPDAVIDAVEAAERRELARRERLYRGGQPAPDVRDRTVILVDDGLATGSTMRAAAQALRLLHPARIIAAVPVGSEIVCASLREVVDDVVCAESPEPFYAVGVWYEEFHSTPDTEVQAALRRAAERRPVARPPKARRGARSDVEVVRAAAEPLTGGKNDYDRLLERIGDARFVLIGEASHGTHDFYRERARITRRLIEERGFRAVAVEADWPDAYRVNRYVCGTSDDPDALAALGDFQRFPRWMWRNADVLEFVEWLRHYNGASANAKRAVGFYGLDLYSLHASIAAVVGYLDRVDPEGAARARYACFDHFGDDPQAYGYATALGTAEPCENKVVGQLVEMQHRTSELLQQDGRSAKDEHFSAVQNARLARNAEAYYRTMLYGRISSWNLRDRHMAETLAALVTHLERHDGQAKVVLWLRNRGDAADVLRPDRLERAIGVIYRPETERFSHYVSARLADQFDAVLHFDETEALVPLDRHAGWETPEELPETFPFGV